MEGRAVPNPSRTSAPTRAKIIKVLVATVSGFSRDHVSIWNRFSGFQPELRSLRTGSVPERGPVSGPKPALWLGEVQGPLRDPHWFLVVNTCYTIATSGLTHVWV